MSLFEHFSEFFTELLGPVEAASSSGEVFIRYGSYIMVVLTIIFLFKCAGWLFGFLRK